MATTDYSGLSDEELDGLYRVTQNSPSLIPNEAERQAVIAEWSRRRAGLKPRAPENVESDLEASATPITPDPAVKPRAAARTSGEILIDQPPTGVQRAAEMESQRGLAAGQSLEEYGEEYGAAIRQRRKEKFADARARLDAGVQDPDQAEYNAATGVVGESSLPPMDGYNEQTKEYTTPRAPLHPMIARDRAIAQQQMEQTATGIGQKYGADNEALYREGIGDGVVDYRAVQSPAEAERNATWAQIENDARMGPPAARQAAMGLRQARDERMRNDPSHVEREIVRWSESTGLPPGQVRQMFAADSNKARVMLRDAASGRRAADRQAAKDHWRAVAMLAGGSQNLNAGNRAFFNQLAMLPEDQRMQQLQYALPGGDRRAAVEARQLDVAARLAGNAIAGQLGGFAQAQNPLVQNQIANQQLAQQQEQIQWAEDNINEKYAYDAGRWGASEFTEAERQQAINDLMVRYGPPGGRMTLAEATRIVDNIGSKKRRPRQAAPSGGPGDDAGAMPAVSA